MKLNLPSEIISNSVEETREFGRRLGEAAEPGDVIGLVGPLGAGKTQLVKGIAVGAGVAEERIVNSPTFVLVNEYEGRLHVFHLDAYRLSASRELAAIGFEEMCAAAGLVVVEWADKVADIMPANTMWITLTPSGETSRRIHLSGNA